MHDRFMSMLGYCFEGRAHTDIFAEYARSRKSNNSHGKKKSAFSIIGPRFDITIKLPVRLWAVVPMT